MGIGFACGFALNIACYTAIANHNGNSSFLTASVDSQYFTPPGFAFVGFRPHNWIHVTPLTQPAYPLLPSPQFRKPRTAVRGMRRGRQGTEMDDRSTAASEPGMPSFRRGTRFVLPIAGLLKFGIDTSRFGELVFENDDAAGGVQSRAARDEFVNARGYAELIAGVSTMAPLGPLWGEEFSGVETT